MFWFDFLQKLKWNQNKRQFVWFFHTKYLIVRILLQKDRTRCLEEIKILQACKHINVIRYKECFLAPISNENPALMIHIVMEYADAGDLGNHIKRQKEEMKTFFAESQVRNWMVQLALALRYLHTKVRVLHRDIKPQNIFMSSTNLLKLGDFGVSKILRWDDDACCKD